MKYKVRKLRKADLWIRQVTATSTPGTVQVGLQLSNEGSNTHTSYEGTVKLSLWQLTNLVREARVVLDKQIAGLVAQRAELG